MEQDHRAYCFEYNEQGFCVTCGERKKPALDELGAWPKGTWFQLRRAAVRAKEAADAAQLSQVQS